MIAAAAAGSIDFTEADSNSARWLIKESLLLRHVERCKILQIIEYYHRQQTAAMVWPDWDTNGKLFSSYYDRATKHTLTAGGLLMPWEKWEDKERYRDELESMRAEYTEKFGDPDSPEAKARERKDLQALKRQQLESAAKRSDIADAQAALAEQLAERRRKRRM